jgi:hypothetical protein
MKKYFYSLLILGLIFSGCTTHQYTNKMTGIWVVEEFRLNGKDLVRGEIQVNMANFNKQGYCQLPIRNLSLSDSANWQIIKKEGSYFLAITAAKDSIFNNDFQIEFSEEKRGLGMSTVVKLTSHNLYWKCVK